MKAKTFLLIISLFLVSCGEWGFYFTDMYLEDIRITNSLYEDKSTIYFECDIFGDSIVEIPYLEECKVPIGQLWKNTNYSHKKTIDKIHNKIIGGYNFKIFRYKNGKRNYFSFKNSRSAHPYDNCTLIDYIDEVDYVHYDIFTEEEFFE